MSAIYLLLPLSLVVATGFLLAFIWAVRNGQFEDTCTPGMRVLTDDLGKSPISPQATCGAGAPAPQGTASKTRLAQDRPPAPPAVDDPGGACPGQMFTNREPH